MSVIAGDKCNLYKTCTVCNEIKWYREFKAKGGRKRSSGRRVNYCRDCKDKRHKKNNQDVSDRHIYTYDVSKLSKVNPILIRGKTHSGYKYEDELSYNDACIYVSEGVAGIVHETLIHNLYNRHSLKLKVLERDNHTCHYCGKYGDTVDHIIPKSKGGKATLKNLVCACFECNNSKGNKNYKKFKKKRGIKNRKFNNKRN